MIIQKKKKRKHRTKGYDLCEFCGYPNCDPVKWKTRSGMKIQKRLREGKCMGCGKIKNECTCKSAL